MEFLKNQAITVEGGVVCEMLQGLVILVIGLFSYAWSSSPAGWVIVIMMLF